MQRKGEILAYLREVTRPAHLAIEGALGLLDDNLQPDRYTQVLVRLYGFWIGWEPQVASLLKDDAFLAPRRRGHLLAADLSARGLSDKAIAALDRPPLADLSDRYDALGSLYVLEGSSLGGRIILQNVERCLGSDGASSSRYFAGYGDDTGRMWREFLAYLEKQPADCKQNIARGALTTFQCLDDWLTALPKTNTTGDIIG